MQASMRVAILKTMYMMREVVRAGGMSNAPRILVERLKLQVAELRKSKHQVEQAGLTGGLTVAQIQSVENVVVSFLASTKEPVCTLA